MYDTKPNPDMYAVGGDVQASGGVYIRATRTSYSRCAAAVPSATC